MSLNRRDMLRFGAVGVGGAMVSSAASSVGLPSIIFQAPKPAILPQPVAAAPQAPLGVNPDLFQRARTALDMHRIAARDFIGIADFSLASSQPRFHIVDLR